MQGQPTQDPKKGPEAAKRGRDPRPGFDQTDRRQRRDQAQPPSQPGPAPQQGVAPPASRNAPAARVPGGQPGSSDAQRGPKRFEEVRKERRQRVEEGGRRTIIQESDNRVIIKQDNRVIVRHNEADRFARRPGARAERRSDGTTETFYDRPDGVRVVTIVDSHGRLLRRYRRDRGGREHNIIDNRRFYRNVGVGVGLGVVGGLIALNLPPPRVNIPRDRYIVDYDDASEDDLYEALDAPPIERLDRAYSLEEIRYNHELRARVRRIDLDTITFEFGSWDVDPAQYPKLERIARAIRRLLDRNPDAVVMIEGHTDAVGSDEDNASLSDRRAAAVADILTEQFDIPAENLVTQGYGEQHLKIDTQEPERANRRVSIRNITDLMAER